MYTKLATIVFASLIIGAGAIALVSRLSYEQTQRACDRELFPQVGRSVDIGGRTLNIYCSGEGQPAVIFESGAPWPLYIPRAMFENGAPRPGYSWVWIQRQLAKTTKACWYDRAGSGWSGLGPYPRDSSSQAHDLHALLRAAGVTPPYVLVAELSAALDAHVYVGSWPEEVAGLVFVNGVPPDFLTRTRPASTRMAKMPEFVNQSQHEMAQVFNQLGFYRTGSPNDPAPAPLPARLTPSEWNTVWHLSRSSQARSALLQEVASWQRSIDQARAAGSFRERPFILLSGENTAATLGYHSVWMELQAELAHLSTRGKLVTIDQGRDDLIYQNPEAVVEATRGVLAEARQLAKLQQTKIE